MSYHKQTEYKKCLGKKIKPNQNKKGISIFLLYLNTRSFIFLFGDSNLEWRPNNILALGALGEEIVYFGRLSTGYFYAKKNIQSELFRKLQKNYVGYLFT